MASWASDKLKFLPGDLVCFKIYENYAAVPGSGRGRGVTGVKTIRWSQQQFLTNENWNEWYAPTESLMVVISHMTTSQVKQAEWQMTESMRYYQNTSNYRNSPISYAAAAFSKLFHKILEKKNRLFLCWDGKNFLAIKPEFLMHVK